MSDDATFQAAQIYAERGWHVFPLHGMRNGQCTCAHPDTCQDSGKHPRTPHGFKDASTDPVQIRVWFDPNSTTYLNHSNLAIATGAISNLVVIDIDQRKNGIKEWGDAEYEALTRDEDLTSRTVVTGSGGLHVYYSYPPDHVVRSRIDFLPGVDCRADGGYVAAPPSVHASGRMYVWKDTTTPIVAPPSTVLELLATGHGSPSGGNLDYTVSLGDVIAGTERIPVGQRDSVFFALACRLRAGDVEIHEAAQLLGRIHESQTDDPETFPPEAVIAKLNRAYELYEPTGDEVSDAERAWAQSQVDAVQPDMPIIEREMWHGFDGSIDTPRANGHRLALRYHDRLRCFHPGSTGVLWYRCGDDGLWFRDQFAAEMYACGLESQIRVEALKSGDDDEQKRLSKWAKASAGVAALDGGVKYARNEPLLAVRSMNPGNYFDANPDVLAAPNGHLINLRDGTDRTLTPDDHCSKTVAEPWCPELANRCPRWLAFLEQILPDPDVRDYVRLKLGMSLLGADKDHEFFILDGSGANGKSTLLKVVMSVLGMGWGGYSNPVPKTVFVTTRDELHPAHTAELDGVRIATNSTELNATDVLNEDLIKSVVSLEPIQTRKMNQDFWLLHPRCTLWLSTNCLPHIHDASIAMQRRLRRVRFEVTLPPPYDPLFAEKLVEAEGPAILATLVADCRRYLSVRYALEVPEAVAFETGEYFSDENPFVLFVKDCLERLPLDADPRNPDHFLSASDARQIYSNWCHTYGRSPMSDSTFGKMMKNSGFPAVKRGGARGYGAVVTYFPLRELDAP